MTVGSRDLFDVDSHDFREMTVPEPTVAKRRFFLPRWLPLCHLSLLIVTLWSWSVVLRTQTTILGYVFKRDFSSVYVGAQIVAEGQGPQLYNLELQRRSMDADILPYRRYTLLPFIYPGYVAVLLSPLARFSLSTAFLFWTAINFVILAWIARRLIWERFASRRLRLAVLVAFLIWIPLQLTLSHGQMGLVCVLGFTEAMTSLQARRQWQAGFWLALGLMKPQLMVLPLFSLALWRCWRTLASFAAVVITVLGISFAKLGFWITAYLRFLAAFNRGGTRLSLYPTAMQNWRGLVSLLLGSDASLAAKWLLALLSIASVGLVVFVSCPSLRDFRPASGLPPHWQTRWGIVICLGILTSPYLYGHDWVVALPALIVLFSLAERLSDVCGQGERAPQFLGWLLAIAPFVSFAAQFGVWPQSTRIQLLPLFMGVLTVTATLVLQAHMDANAHAMNSEP